MLGVIGCKEKHILLEQALHQTLPSWQVPSMVGGHTLDEGRKELCTDGLWLVVCQSIDLDIRTRAIVFYHN